MQNKSNDKTRLQENEVFEYEVINENIYEEEGQSKDLSRWKKLALGLSMGLVTIALLFTVFLPAFGLGQYINDRIDRGQISQTLLPSALRADKDDQAAQNQLRKLQVIYDFLKNNYYRELSDEEMIEAMYSGLMNEMDSPYTFYLTSEEYTAMFESMQGEYSGIGAQVSQRDGKYFISDVFDDSPALEAGLRNGDQILSVDGVSVTEFTDVSVLATNVRGEEGTEVVLEIYRETEGQEHTIIVTRGKVTTANLKYEMLEEGIGYVRIIEFNSGVADNFINALDNLAAEGAQTIIFDLRYNGGGYVSEVTKMLDYLLPKADLAIAKGRSQGLEFEEAWTSTDGIGVPEEWQYTILINEYSASASELFSGALRDLKASTLVGKKSFGKGVGSITYELSDGSAIQITNFHYYLPSGDSVEQNGLEPDHEIELDDEVKGLPISLLEDKDKQLDLALDLARDLIGKESSVELEGTEEVDASNAEATSAQDTDNN